MFCLLSIGGGGKHLQPMQMISEEPYYSGAVWSGAERAEELGGETCTGVMQ